VTITVFDKSTAGGREAKGGARRSLRVTGPLLNSSILADGPHGVVAANVFHRAFALGPLDRLWPAAGIDARRVINGESRPRGTPGQDRAELVCSVAALLDAMGERVKAGDRLIMGSIVQAAVAPGDEVVAELRGLGSVQLTIDT
jgi:2-keto-4-pentenoate hydratase